MPEPFNHTLLLLARQYRERSQSDVARASGLTQGHYSRIENGLLPEGPAEDNVTRIGKALSFPPSFFYQTERLSGSRSASIHSIGKNRALASGC